MANEKWLIDADDLVAQFRKTKVIEVFPNWKELPPNVTSAIIRFARKWRTIILNAPTVDAVEVVHGRWNDFARGKMCCCSICKFEFDNTCNDIHGEWHHCPNCGAKMEGGNKVG